MAGKIFIFILALVVITFAIRFSTTLPAVQNSHTASSSPAVATGTVASGVASGTPAAGPTGTGTHISAPSSGGHPTVPVKQTQPMVTGHSIVISSPALGDTYAQGSKITLKWSVNGIDLAHNLVFDLVSDASPATDVVFFIGPDPARYKGGADTWVVPETVAPGTYRIRITDAAYVPTVVAFSGAFTVTPFVAAIATSSIPQGFTRSDLSPYFHEILFSGVSRAALTLSASFSGGGHIDVNGWFIKSRRGGQTIPQAVNVYDPLGLTPETDIILTSGDQIHMYSSVSGVGKNFRINRCIGYLAKDNRFSPALPSYCEWPVISDQEFYNFTSKCQDYLSSRLGSCSISDFNSSGLSQYDYGCQDYFKTVNFKGCFDSHAGDKNFLTNQIWVWTANPDLVDARHDRVMLFDNSGLYVSEYDY